MVITSKPSLFYPFLFPTEKFLVFFKKFSVLSVYREQEIDFYATKDGKSYLVQVAYSIADEDTYNREFALFNNWTSPCEKSLSLTMTLIFPQARCNILCLKIFWTWTIWRDKYITFWYWFWNCSCGDARNWRSVPCGTSRCWIGFRGSVRSPFLNRRAPLDALKRLIGL